MPIYENLFRRIAAKTAAYQVKPEDHGTIFTTRGASSGTITFTLPAAADVQAGWHAKFFAVGAAAMKVASADGDNIVALNDAAADSVLVATGSAIIGNGFEFTFDGTGFLAEALMPVTANQTLAS